MKHDARAALFVYAGLLAVALLLAYFGDVAFFRRVYDVPRLRVVAHSDAPYDQWVKGEIARIALSWWEVASSAKGRGAQNSPDRLRGTSLALSGDDLEVLRRAVRTWLAEGGVPYGFRIDVGEIAQPPRTYGGHLLAAGEAPTILITLGEGKGHNFWTLLFPHLTPKGAYLQESPPRSEGNALSHEREEERRFPDRVDQLALTGGSEPSPLLPFPSRAEAEGRQEGKFAWHFYVWDFVHSLWERTFYR
ncbi:stage II sporulation protein R [Brockia lithotrophica]|uniref:Stage II sporulation protein R n=1 Tax=Brockia lithotrophica TaxID=933949 RepID=A0A660KTB8_9BACL|nr:stage II sporulation protein R [Brockia lithotrophica]RKQ83857.1 stage II sporulation protein R [Brockia lithotrophica]